MNYEKIYEAIIERRKLERPEGYVENHHIVPRCLGGKDEDDNVVAITAREHFLCHWLLVKMYTGADKMRLSAAFNSMCRMSDGQIRNSKNFAVARKHFSDNHPCKVESTRNKISASLRRYYSEAHTGIFRNYENRICPSCGVEYRVWPSDPQIYCGVGCSRKSITDATKKKISATMNKRLGDMTPEERRARMLPAITADKGVAISAAKRGKKTNQKNLEIEKYGKMTEDEFNAHLVGRTKQVASRMMNRRKLYGDIHGTKFDA